MCTCLKQKSFRLQLLRCFFSISSSLIWLKCHTYENICSILTTLWQTAIRQYYKTLQTVICLVKEPCCVQSLPQPHSSSHFWQTHIYLLSASGPSLGRLQMKSEDNGFHISLMLVGQGAMAGKSFFTAAQQGPTFPVGILLCTSNNTHTTQLDPTLIIRFLYIVR